MLGPFVFIVGCARSGTTLLQRIVDAHPLIAITPSMHWISGYLREHKVKRPDDRVTPELVFGLLENPRFTRFRIHREELEKMAGSREPPTYSGFISGIFDLYGRAEGKPLVGNKTAPYVRRIPELHATWPEARFVHIVRDGRDVCLSVLNWDSAEGAAGRYSTWEEDPVSTTALWWERKVRAGREAGASLGGGLYHEVRYEALIADPRRECEALCEFLGVPYDGAMLGFAERREETDPDLERAHPTMPITSGLRDWSTEMSPEDVERFEAAAGDLLDELNYPRAFPDPSPEAMERAAKVRESFGRDVGDRLPERRWA